MRSFAAVLVFVAIVGLAPAIGSLFPPGSWHARL